MIGGKCVRCGMTIAFVRMAGAESKVRPVDPVPDSLGTILAERAGSRFIRGVVSAANNGTPPGRVRLRSHFETCSNLPARKTPKPPPDLSVPLPL